MVRSANRNVVCDVHLMLITLVSPSKLHQTSEKENSSSPPSDSHSLSRLLKSHGRESDKQVDCLCDILQLLAEERESDGSCSFVCGCPFVGMEDELKSNEKVRVH